MKTTTKITTDVSKMAFGYWDAERDEFVPIDCTAASLKNAAEKLNCSPELLEAIDMSIEILRNRIATDLIGIWKRLDKAGIP